MKWAELLAQLTCDSPPIQKQAIREQFIPFIDGATELSEADCKGIIVCVLVSTTAPMFSVHLANQLQNILRRAARVKGAAEVLCATTAATLSREMFKPHRLSGRSAAFFATYVATILGAVSTKGSAADIVAGDVSKWKQTPEDVPSYEQLLRHLATLLRTVASHDAFELSHGVKVAFKRTPGLVQHAVAHAASVVSSGQSESASYNAYAVLLIAEVLRCSAAAGSTIAATPALEALFKLLEASVAQSGSSDVAVWRGIDVKKQIPALNALPVAWHAGLLRTLAQALNKSPAVGSAPASVLVPALAPEAIQEDGAATSLLTNLLTAVKDPASQAAATETLVSLCVVGRSGPVLKSVFTSLNTAFGQCKEVADRVSVLSTTEAVIEPALGELKTEASDTIKSEVLASLKQTLSAGATEVKVAAMRVVLIAVRAGIIPDYLVATVANFIKPDADERLRRVSLLVASTAYRVGGGGADVQGVVAPIKAFAGLVEARAPLRPDLAVGLLPLVSSKKEFQKGDAWFKNGLLAPEGYLVSAEVLRKLSEEEDGAQLLHGVVDAIDALLPPDSVVIKDIFNVAKGEGLPVLRALLLLATCRTHAVRSRAFAVLEKFLTSSKEAPPQLWEAWKATFLPVDAAKSAEAAEDKSKAKAPAKAAAPKAGGKPAPKGKKGPGASTAPAKAPEPQAASSEQGAGEKSSESAGLLDPTASGSVRCPAQEFETSLHNSGQLLAWIARRLFATLKEGKDKEGLIAQVAQEIVLYSHHPSVMGDAPQYWVRAIRSGIYDDFPQSHTFNTIFAERSDAAKKTTAEAAAAAPAAGEGEALDGHGLLKLHLEEITRYCLKAVKSTELHVHVAAVRSLSSLIGIGGAPVLETVLNHADDGLVKALDEKSVRGFVPLQARLYNASAAEFDAIVEREISEELGTQYTKEDKKSTRESKLYSMQDQQWEEEYRRQQAKASGQDEASRKASELRERLRSKHSAAVAEVQQQVYPVMCALKALNHLACTSSSKAAVSEIVGAIAQAVMPCLAGELRDVFLLARNTLQHLLECSELAPLAGRLSILLGRFGAASHDPTRTPGDDDALLCDKTMPLLRLQIQQQTLSANAFSILLPMLYSVLTRETFLAPAPTNLAAAALAGPAALMPLQMQMLGAQVLTLAPKDTGDKKKPGSKGAAKAVPVPAPVIAIPHPSMAAAAPALEEVERPREKLNTAFQNVTQTQCLNIIHAHCGLTNLPARTRSDMVEILTKVLHTIPSLFRSAVRALTTLSAQLIPDNIDPILRSLQSPNMLIREQALSAMENYSIFAGYQEEVAAEGEPAPHTAFSDTVRQHVKLEELLWILQHDENKETVTIAQRLRSNADMQVTPEFLTRIVPYTLHEEESVRQNAGRSIAVAIEKFPESLNAVLDQVFAAYTANLQDIRPGKKTGPERCGTPFALSCLNGFIPAKDLPKVFTFLCSSVLADKIEEVRAAALEAGQLIITPTQGATTQESLAANSKELLPVLQKLLDKPAPAIQSSDKAIKDNYTATVVVWMSSTASHAGAGTQIRPVLDRLMGVLDINSDAVQRAASGCLINLLSLPSAQPHASALVKQCTTKIFKQGVSRGVRRGNAFGLGGIVKGGGLPLIWEENVIAQLIEASNNKNSPGVREGALTGMGILCEVLGFLFEPYIAEHLQIVLNGFADKSVEVRETAEDTAKGMMKSLSDNGVREVLPQLLQSLNLPDNQWRVKVTSVELLGSMAYLSPKQLAACLPTIIPKLVSMLADTRVDVSSAAFSSLRRVGGVIANEEIAQHVDVVLRALERPQADTETALDALMFTRFVHTVDAPALALIYPILYRGLRERSSAIKMKAAQIVGSMSQLLADPSVMAPYLKQLTPQLKHTLLDPTPEVRSTSAKALGALVKGLGETRFPGLMSWLLETTKTEASPVERAGAAQGLSEVIAAVGFARLDVYLPDILEGTVHQKAHVREGFLNVFVFLPIAMSTAFQPYLPRILPPVLRGLADDAETVRIVALRSGQTIVSQYGQSCLNLLLPALQEGLSSELWRIRHSSLLLLGDLLMRVATANMPTKGLTGLFKKQETEDEAEEEEEEEEEEDEEEEEVDVSTLNLAQLRRLRLDKSTNSCAEALYKVIDTRTVDHVLSLIYIAKSDTQPSVRSEANSVWKALVDNTPSMLRKLMDTLVEIIVQALSGGDSEMRVVAGRALGDVVSRLGESVIPHVLPILREGLKSDDVDTRNGVCIGLKELLGAATRTQLISHTSVLINAITEATCDEDETVRINAGFAFDQLFKQLGAKSTEDLVHTLISGLEASTEANREKALNGLVQVLTVRPKAVLHLVVPAFCRQGVLSEKQAIVIQRVAPETAQYFQTHVAAILPALVQTLGAQPAYAATVYKAAEAVIETLDIDTYGMAVQEIYRSTQNPSAQTRRGGVALVRSFCAVMSAEKKRRAAERELNKDEEEDEEPEPFWNDYTVSLINYTIRLFADQDEGVRVESLQAMNAITSALDKDAYRDFLSTVHEAIQVTARSSSLGSGKAGIPVFGLPRGMTPVLSFYTETVRGGDPEARGMAARGLSDLIQWTPQEQLGQYVSGIAGAVIRVFNEKTLQASAKQAMMHTMILLVERAEGKDIKPFLPQLQTTLSKAVGEDNAATRLEGLRLMYSILYRCKTDSPTPSAVITDAHNQLQQQKHPDVQASLLRVATIVLARKGANIAPAAATSVKVRGDFMTSVEAACRSDVRAVVLAGHKALGLLKALDNAEDALQEGLRMTQRASEEGLAMLQGAVLAAGDVSASALKPVVEIAVQLALKTEDTQACVLALRLGRALVEKHANRVEASALNTLAEAFFKVVFVGGRLWSTSIERHALLGLLAFRNKPASVAGLAMRLASKVLENLRAPGDANYQAILRLLLNALTQTSEWGSTLTPTQKKNAEAFPLTSDDATLADLDPELEDEEERANQLAQ